MIPIFAVIYFGIMIDAGLFDPMVNRILKLVKGDPVKITIGAAVLAMLVSLDGDGTTTFIISVSAMLPITTKLKMNPLIKNESTYFAVCSRYGGWRYESASVERADNACYGCFAC